MMPILPPPPPSLSKTHSVNSVLKIPAAARSKAFRIANGELEGEGHENNLRPLDVDKCCYLRNLKEGGKDFQADHLCSACSDLVDVVGNCNEGEERAGNYQAADKVVASLAISPFFVLIRSTGSAKNTIHAALRDQTVWTLRARRGSFSN